MKPKLNLIYIDNYNYNTPPSQPTLIYPIDGSILYNTSTMQVNTLDSVELEWASIASASSYKLYLSSGSGLNVYDSSIHSGFSSSTFTTATLNPGESYEWWVQGYNQSIPGQISDKWIFGIGKPDHVNNNDGTFSYNFSDSSEIIDFNHPNIIDTQVTDANSGTNYGDSGILEIGGGCQDTANSVCAAIISVDTSQLPLDSNTQTIHSINLDLRVESWDLPVVHIKLNSQFTNSFTRVGAKRH